MATGDASAQAEAVSCLQGAVAATGDDDPDRTAYLCSLSSALRELHGYTGDAELLRTAVRVPTAATELIAAYRQAASYAKLLDDTGLAASWNSLGSWLCERYQRTGDLNTLTEAVAADRMAVSAREPRRRRPAHATRRLRDRYPGSPAAWAAHIHTGP